MSGKRRRGSVDSCDKSERCGAPVVRNSDIANFDIHDRVNYSVKKSVLKVNEDHTLVKLKLTVDTKFGSVMDYFEIFLNRMILCRKAADKLGLEFKLIINEQQLI